jgi:hypothetical protein
VAGNYVYVDGYVGRTAIAYNLINFTVISEEHIIFILGVEEQNRK